MSLLPFAVLAALATPTAAPIKLARVFTANESLSYRVQSSLQVQSRVRGLNTWMPEDLTMRYEFTTAVEQLKTDGIAQIRYKRPTMTLVEDTGEEHGPKRDVEKLNWDLRLTLSPYNKVLEMKDLAPSKPLRVTRSMATAQAGIDQFIGEVYRLALFAGSLDSSLDLAPPLPLREVAKGDTWHATVSYQPQKKGGAAAKNMVQRLDYTYTYGGIMTVNGAQVHRVVGELDLNTDLAEFLKEELKEFSAETNLDKFPLRLKTKIDFDLDLKTMRTLRARANSQGGFEVFLTNLPDSPLAEEKFSGGTTLSLLSASAKPAPKPAPPKKAPAKKRR